MAASAVMRIATATVWTVVAHNYATTSPRQQGGTARSIRGPMTDQTPKPERPTLEEIRGRHGYVYVDYDEDRCKCGQGWPCDTAVVLAALGEAKEAGREYIRLTDPALACGSPDDPSAGSCGTCRSYLLDAKATLESQVAALTKRAEEAEGKVRTEEADRAALCSYLGLKPPDTTGAILRAIQEERATLTRERDGARSYSAYLANDVIEGKGGYKELVATLEAARQQAEERVKALEAERDHANRAARASMERRLSEARKGLTAGAAALQAQRDKLSALCLTDKPHDHKMLRALDDIIAILDTAQAAAALKASEEPKP